MATEIARQGYRLVMVVRNPDLGSEVQASIRSSTGNDDVHLLVADLSSQRQIRRLAAEFIESNDALHVLVNNAGGIFGSRTMTEDGLDLTFALNHLGYFLLTSLLLDVLTRSAPSRIVSTSSGAHVMGRMDFGNLQGERRFRSFGAYTQSKLANVMFTYELARRLEGTGVTANCFDPGFTSTRFGESGTPFFGRLMRIVDFVRISPEKGADTGIHLATSPDVDGVTGKYFQKRRAARSSRISYDVDAQKRLWALSEELVTGSRPPR